MSYLYLMLNIGSIAIPLAFSFHPKLKFYKHWKSFCIAIIISSTIFIVWDIFFTKNEIWGFNQAYLLGVTITQLPIEEWLFFICIPYACIFTHYSLLQRFPNLGLNKKKSRLIGFLLIFLFILIAILNTDKSYTFTNFALAGIVLIIITKYDEKLLSQYLITYLIIFVPFLVINGILTGSFIENEVVWYNNNENLGIRLFTIPIEDTVYAFSLILIPLSIMKKLNHENLVITS